MTAMDNVVGIGANAGAGGNHPARKSRVLWFGMGLVLIILLLAAIVLYLNMNNKQDELEASLEQQEMALATGRSQSISMWLDDLETQGDRIVNGGVFRLFASDISLLDGDVSVMFDSPENAPQSQRDEIIDLARQLPMLRNILRESTAYAGFLSSRIINSRCETYVASETGVPRLSSEQVANVKAVLDSGKTRYSNVYVTSNGLLIDVFMPIFPPQVDDNTVKPVSVLMLSRIVTPRLSEFVKQSPLADHNIKTYLVQVNKDQLELITPGLGADSLRRLDMGIIDSGEGTLPFANRIGVTGENVYSLAVKVPGVDWWLFEEIEYDTAMADLNKSSRVAVGIALLVSLVLILVVSLLWWWLVGNEHRQTAARVQSLLNYIEEQKELLDGINATITDLISLTDDKGVIQYANLAFAEAVGRREDEVVGLDIPALFGFDTGKRLIGSDHQVLMTGEALVVNETIYLQGAAFVASGMGVETDSKWQGFKKGFFSGQSMFLIKCSGTGDLWFNAYGGIIELDVNGDYVVDTGYIVGFTDVEGAGRSLSPVLPYLGDDAIIYQYRTDEILLFNGLGSIRNTSARRKIYEIFSTKNII